MPLGVRRAHMPAAISACGCAPVASTTQRARRSCTPPAVLSRAPTTQPASSIGASNRAGGSGRAPAATAARHRMWSSSRRGSTANSPGTSMRRPLGPMQPTCPARRAAAITSSNTPSLRMAWCASGIRPSPHTLSRGKACWSASTTRIPACASVRAAALPAGPAPTTSTSQAAGSGKPAASPGGGVEEVAAVALSLLIGKTSSWGSGIGLRGYAGSDGQVLNFGPARRVRSTGSGLPALLLAAPTQASMPQPGGLMAPVSASGQAKSASGPACLRRKASASGRGR